MKKIRVNTRGLVTISLFILILLIGSTYAWLTVTLKGVNNNVIKAGTLNLFLDEKDSVAISLINTVPVTDSDGLKTNAYTFKLKNIGDISSQYTIYLDDIELEDGETRMLDKYVKYSLTKDSDTPVTALLTTIGENPNRILDTGVIKKDTTQTYTLRLWIDKDADNAVMNTTFRAKLRVEATQTNAPKTYIVGNSITVGSESFYVISDNGETVSALAAMNVDTTTNLQSSTANTVTFDDDSNVYEGSQIQEYVNSYVNNLNIANGTSITGRLMTYDEATILKTNDNYKSWLFATNYWLETGKDDNRVWRVSSQNQIVGNDRYDMNFGSSSFGVRPVITIIKTEL